MKAILEGGGDLKTLWGKEVLCDEGLVVQSMGARRDCVEKEMMGPWALCERKGLLAPIEEAEPLVLGESNSLGALLRFQKDVCVLCSRSESGGISRVTPQLLTPPSGLSMLREEPGPACHQGLCSICFGSVWLRLEVSSPNWCP